MAHTSHGHHISGTALDANWSGSIARCGGPGLCTPCSKEASWYGFTYNEKRHNMSEGLSNQEKAQTVVFKYVRDHLEKTDTHVKFELSDVYVVSFTYILGNWKAMVSTTLPDGMYYEVTYDKNKLQTYLDAYKKFENVCIPD